MEYNICNNDKKIILVCDEIHLKDENDKYILDFNLKNGCSFDIVRSRFAVFLRRIISAWLLKKIRVCRPIILKKPDSGYV